LGVPVRVLRGWSPERTTVHYDAAGNITGRSVHWCEPVWDEQSRAEMIAMAVWEAQQCPLCGGPRAECQSAEADDAYDAVPVRCHKSTAVGQAQRRYEDSPQPHALLWETKRRG
jgi:hypothetical protein